jgi:glycosyltransferase involved in cell wall biosynthesis
MNECDEVWATSEWVADVFDFNGVRPDIHVYPHGIDPIWQPVERKAGDVVKFLHVGEPALRKGGQLALDAFRAAFDDREDVQLTIKAQRTHYVRGWDKYGTLTTPDKAFNNVVVLDNQMTKAELVALYASHDVMVYPTFGEGFGFIPLQALATGMPCITTANWAPYKEFIQMPVKAEYIHSPWPVHPGSVYSPDFENLRWWMRMAKTAIDPWHTRHYSQALKVIESFDWLKVTEKAFKHLTDK